jgi:hypothetical protein
MSTVYIVSKLEISSISAHPFDCTSFPMGLLSVVEAPGAPSPPPGGAAILKVRNFEIFRIRESAKV